MKKYVWLFTSLLSLKALAQEATDSTTSKWNFSAWTELFILPDEQNFFNPTFYARTTTLHLEGRYNYEDRNTVSLWAGRRFRFGKDVEFLLVPMAAVILGNTGGMAPGLEAEISYRKLDFYSESEYVFNFQSKEDNFFYIYSELAARPLEPLRIGLMAQRTRVVQAEREIQRGLFAEYYFGRFRAGAFYFNPFSSSYFWLASVSVDF
jgi:hypothetical protein